MSSLMEKIDSRFGAVLIDHLIERLDITAREYIGELESMVLRLQRNAETNEELLERIKNRYDQTDDTQVAVPDENDDGVTEWEKRLAQLEGPSKP